jgi:hypothetical protein
MNAFVSALAVWTTHLQWQLQGANARFSAITAHMLRTRIRTGALAFREVRAAPGGPRE